MKKPISLLTLITAALLLVPGCGKEPDSDEPAQQSTAIKLGHVGHDHHLALFVAADNADEYARQVGIGLKPSSDRKFYQLTDNNRKVADVEIVKVGEAKMPTALAQNVIEVGFGGVAAVLGKVDSGAPVKLIAPLHYKGDMFVVRPDLPVQLWREFVQLAKDAEKPLRIGYKNPVAVAKVIFEEALQHEGITFSGDPTQANLQVHMVNVKGGGKLNVALAGGLVDGYVGKNPFPAIGVEKKILRIICDLEDLPPGTFRNHPCCCIAANAKAIREKPEAIVDLLMLFLQATETINVDLDKSIAAASHLIGTSEAVERMSIPTSGYSMEPSDEWRQTMNKWIQAMNGLDVFKNKLKGLPPQKAAELAYDFSLLNEAKKKLAKRKEKK